MFWLPLHSVDMFHCIARTQLVILTLGVTCIVGLNEKQKYVEARVADTAEARESGKPRKPPIGRLRPRVIFEMGFKQPKNTIRLIGLVLPRLLSQQQGHE
jgi:hypothetical protein